MAIDTISIESLIKVDNQTPWMISYISPTTRDLEISTLGNGGDIALGRCFNEVLSIIESNITAFPYILYWNKLGVSNKESFTAHVFAGSIGFMEINPIAYKEFKATNRIKAASAIYQYTIRELLTPSESTDYFITGTLAQLTQAGLIRIDVTGFSQGLSDPELSVGNTIQLKLDKITIPLPKLDVVEQDNTSLKVNRIYSHEFNLSLDNTYRIGLEAKEFTEKLLSQSGQVVIKLSLDENGTYIKENGAFLGTVYKTDLKTSDDFFNSSGTIVSNINDTLLSTGSTQIKSIPLAIQVTQENGATIISMSMQAMTPGNSSSVDPTSIVKKDTATNKKKLSSGLNKGKDSNQVDDLDPESITTVKYMDSPSNLNDFFQPLDDRYDELFSDVDNLYRVRIGDVMLVIPPLAIQLNRKSTLNKIKTLRSKSSMITKVGSSFQTLTLTLYFHSLDSINGYKKARHKDLPGEYYYMDGLRTLIAQFKKVPFVPIDNEYINNTLKIDSVTLMDLNVSTVPGFPHSLSATLTLGKFDVKAYLPQCSYLEEAINYPLMRWYYQECMRKPDSKLRTYLAPITGSLTNDFTFQIANEEDLQKREDAVLTYQSMISPDIYTDDIDNKNNEIGKRISDGRKAQLILDELSAYQSAKPLMPTSTGKNSDGWKKYDNNAMLSPNSSRQLSVEAYNQIYGNNSPTNYASGTIQPVESWDFQYSYPANYDEQTSYKQSYNSGCYIIGLDSSTNKQLFKSADSFTHIKNSNASEEPYIGVKSSDGSDLYIGSLNDVSKLNTIVQRGKDAKSQAQSYIDKYNKLSNEIALSEANLKLDDYDIPGLLPINVQVIYENNFAQMQLTMNETPTFQYLGSQDPYIQVQFEATQEAVASLQELLTTADQYSLKYRLGISSGFLGVKNQLTAMFGVQAVMAEVVAINTVPNFPGRFQIEMTLCGFNKTQKRTEKLEGISPIYGMPNMKNQSADNTKSQDKKSDQITELRMGLLEVYPDLELPTYDEVNAALPYIGADVLDFANYTGGKFVDPDFYVASTWSLREQLRADKDEEQVMNFKDTAGVQMYTGSQHDLPLNASDDMFNLVHSVDSKTPSIDYRFNWFGETDGVSDSQSGTDDSKNIKWKSKDVEKFAHDRKAIAKPPTKKQWISWGNSANSYSPTMGDRQPNDLEIYKEIYSLIASYWGGIIYDDWNPKKWSKAWEKVCYSTVGDFYKATWNLEAQRHPSLAKKKKVSIGKLSVTEFKRGTNGMVPKERLANYIKSILAARSNWRQFYDNGVPFMDYNHNGVGIGGYPISTCSTVDEAQRLMWDWKYNISMSIGHMYSLYKDALNMKNISYGNQPLDWMVAAYEDPSKNSKGEFTTTLKTSFYAITIGKYNTYFGQKKLIFGTPNTPASTDIYSYRLVKPTTVKKLIKGDKDTMISELVSNGYRHSENDSDGGKNWLTQELWDNTTNAIKLGGLFRNTQDSKSETQDWLEGRTQGQVQQIYRQWFGSKEAIANTTNAIQKGLSVVSNIPILQLGSAAAGIINSIFFNAADRGKEQKNYRQVEKAGDFVDNALGNRLVSDKTPQELYAKMFTDMIEYDMHNRLCRAFPTFQLFFIDEGRWMGNYRIWDNLYGFNALQSIDVHRDRKIAADTAVIQMTNLYSNMTARPASGGGDWDYSWWNNLILGNPNQQLLDARKELQDALFIQTGARIHLRMGYGSNATYLPVVFNGVITELSTEDVIQVVAQGDGLELSNVISGDPSDTNSNLFHITEPRDLICQLMTSKGSWLKDVINNVSKNSLFRDNPNGVMHFGRPDEGTPIGNINPWNSDYGEAAQNIYSSNGINTFSQWTMQDGSRIPFSFEMPVWRWIQPGDEMNVKLKLYNKTIWDVAQIIAYCSPDYICQVHPFETRSTLFFGKPYWELAYRYDSRYEYDKSQSAWVRYIDKEWRKPYMQFHYLDSTMDVICNRITASADNLYTNVIVNYDNHQTPVIYADFDIYNSQQKTTVIDADIVSRKLINGFTSADQAMFYGCSALKDYMKDMYQGQMIIMGDPTLKPHDMCYINDKMSWMEGNFQVKSVTHHFALDTGFISTICPDAVAVNDDLALLTQTSWLKSMGVGLAASLMGKEMVANAVKRVTNSAVMRTGAVLGKKTAKKAYDVVLKNGLKLLPDNDEENLKAFKVALSKFLARGSSSTDRTAAKEAMGKALDSLSGKIKGWKAAGDFKKASKVADAAKYASKIKIRRYYHASKDLYNIARGAKGLFSVGKDVGSVAKNALTIGRNVIDFSGIGLVVNTSMSIGTEALNEWARRKKASMQAVIMLPLRYQNKPFTAGINGHRGMVVGDTPSATDKLLNGIHDKSDSWLTTAVKDIVNAYDWFSNTDQINGISEKDLENGNVTSRTNN